VEAEHALSSPLGRITISSDAIAQIVNETARECYGIVGMAGRKWLPDRVKQGHGHGERSGFHVRTPGLDLIRGLRPQGIQVAREGEGVAIDLHVVVEYGLNLAEVASTVRNRVAYEVHRLTGLPVNAVEVHIDDVRRSA
jgi:uncharacterized alkaline shock family protein YloU